MLNETDETIGKLGLDLGSLTHYLVKDCMPSNRGIRWRSAPSAVE